MKNYLLKITFSLLGILIMTPNLAFAFAPLDPNATDGMALNTHSIVENNFNQSTDENSLNVIVAQIIKVFLGLLATIFIVLFIIAGYNWMTAAGQEKKVEKAQETIKTAIIGLIIVVAAYIITYFIFSAIPDGV